MSQLLFKLVEHRDTILRTTAVVFVTTLIIAVVTVSIYYTPIKAEFYGPSNTTTPRGDPATPVKLAQALRNPTFYGNQSTTDELRKYRFSPTSDVDPLPYMGNMFDPMLTRCRPTTEPAEQLTNGVMVVQDLIPGCSYYFHVKARMDNNEAQQWCQSFNTSLAIIESYQEQCLIAHEVTKWRQRAATSISKLWISGHVSTDVRLVNRRPVINHFLVWNDERTLEKSDFQHPCARNSDLKDRRLAMDFETFPGIDFQYSCWSTNHRTDQLAVLCKRCLV